MTFFKKNIKVQLLLITVVLFIKVQSYGQCDSLISSFPNTVNNITINEANTDTITGSYPFPTFTTCGVTSGTFPLSDNKPFFIQTLSFSDTVNNIIYVITASDSTSTAVESFSFTINKGTLSCTQTGGCLYTQQSNLFSSNSNYTDNGHDNGAYITLNSTIPYDTIKVYGTGGNSGSFMSLCATSVGTNSGVNQLPVSNTRLLNLYPNPTTGKLYIGNFDANQKNANVEITDVTGKVILKQQSVINNNTVELNLDVNNGIYFVKVINDNGTIQVQKVIINK